MAVIFMRIMVDADACPVKKEILVLAKEFNIEVSMFFDNAHIYEDQLELMRDVQLKREPFPSPELNINPDIKTLDDIETWVTTDDFEVTGYQHHEPIKYPFSV